MQKVKREKAVSTPYDFYKVYLDSLPLSTGLTRRQRDILCILFAMRYNDVKLTPSARLVVARRIGITYHNLSTVIKQLKDSGVILEIKGGFVYSPLYIPAHSSEIITSITYNGEDRI